MDEDKKRLFFGVEVTAPWPESFPKGRVMDVESRHITLAFLGNVSYSKIEKHVSEIPTPDWKFGQVGFFEKCIFLPPDKPRVVAWDPVFFDDRMALFQKEFSDWLRSLDFTLEERAFLPHMTIARAPFLKKEWKETFIQLPFYATHMHLYESLGNSKYKPLWTHPIHPPFIEIEHVADIAFHIYGDIYLNAQMALAFKYPEIRKFLHPYEKKESVSEIVMALNEIIAELDREIGSPFKAVSFHGEIQEYWEMIIDV